MPQHLRGVGAHFRAPEQTAGRLVESKNQAAGIDHEGCVFSGIQRGLQTEDFSRILDGEKCEPAPLVGDVEYPDLGDP